MGQVGPWAFHDAVRTVHHHGELLTELIGSDGLLLVVSATIFGPLTGWIAGRRDRHPLVWLAFGALLGPIAPLILVLAPLGRCPRCDTPVHGWRANCQVCDGPLSARARAESAIPRSNMESAAIDAPQVSVARRDPGRRDPPALPGPPPVRRLARPPRTPRSGRPIDLGSGGATARAPAVHAIVDAGEVLATAVYFGGSTTRLVVGSRYVIVRHDAVLRILGPVDRDPSEVALERPLAGLTATVIGERLIITEGAGDRGSLALAMGAIAGASGPQLELALSAPVEPSSGHRPASG